MKFVCVECGTELESIADLKDYKAFKKYCKKCNKFVRIRLPDDVDMYDLVNKNKKNGEQFSLF